MGSEAPEPPPATSDTPLRSKFQPSLSLRSSDHLGFHPHGQEVVYRSPTVEDFDADEYPDRATGPAARPHRMRRTDRRSSNLRGEFGKGNAVRDDGSSDEPLLTDLEDDGSDVDQDKRWGGVWG